MIPKPGTENGKTSVRYAPGRADLSRKWIMWIVVLSAIAVVAGCSSSSTESDRQTPTTTSVTASVASPKPPGPLRIQRVEDFGVPVAGTVFEELLARLPDNTATRSYTKLSDFAGTMKVLGLERVPPGSDFEAKEKFFIEMIDTEIGGFGGLFPAWPADMRDYFTAIDWYPYVAFDFLSVDHFATASNQFRSATRQAGEVRLVYDIAFGQFDPDATANALLACECDQPDIREHNGVEFLSWSEEGVSGGQFLKPPMYDDIGRGPRLLIRDGEAYRTIWDVEMEDLIDVLTGSQKSIADDDDYMAAVRWLSALGTMRDITLMSGGFSVDEVEAPSGSEFFKDVAEETQLLRPFEFVAVGTGIDGERGFSGLVIGNADGETAELNAEILVERLSDGRVNERRDLRWSDIADIAEIDVVDNLLIARIYFTDGHTWQELIGPATRSLVVHE